MAARRFTAEQRKAQRRKRTAIILGNLIIVGVFILRDVLRESVRERLDVVHATQLTYVSRFDVGTVLAQMMDFRSGVNAFIYRSELRETKKASEEDNLAYEIAQIIQRVSTERAMLQNDETLVRAIDKHWDEYWELKNTSDAVDRTLRQIEDTKGESAAQKRQDVLKLSATDDPLLKKIAALGQHAWESSKELSDTLEKRNRCINYSFFALFIIGVVVNTWGALSAGLEIEQDSL
jgi:hypothetical protein